MSLSLGVTVDVTDRLGVKVHVIALTPFLMLLYEGLCIYGEDA